MKELFDPKKTAIINVDIQNDYCSINSPLLTLNRFNSINLDRIKKENNRIIHKIEDFISIGREYGLPIIWTKMTESNSNNNSPQKIYEKFSEKKPIKLALQDTEGFQFYIVQPKKEDIIITKNHYNAFIDKKLTDYLLNNKINNVILTGFTLSACIRASVQGANELGFHVIVAEDIVGDFNSDSRSFNLNEINNFFGHVTESNEIINIWNSFFKKKNKV